jgi:hypothetical protein
MSGIENHVDWTAASTPRNERVGPGLAPPKTPPAATSRRNVMDTLLGENKLTAIDIAGSDPYNATGRLFRR